MGNWNKSPSKSLSLPLTFETRKTEAPSLTRVPWDFEFNTILVEMPLLFMLSIQGTRMDRGLRGAAYSGSMRLRSHLLHGNALPGEQHGFCDGRLGDDLYDFHAWN